MDTFKAFRSEFRHTQHLDAPPSLVFPLLCPTREYDWIPTWKCDLIYSESGFAERFGVFRTDFPGYGRNDVWVISRYEPETLIQFVRVNPIRASVYTIRLEDKGDGTTEAVWEELVTALNEEGNEYLTSYTGEDFQSRIVRLEVLLNHYLRTGMMAPDVHS